MHASHAAQLIRSRPNDPGSFVLDYVFDGSIVHKIVEHTSEGHRLEGSSLHFFRCDECRRELLLIAAALRQWWPTSM